MSNETETQGEQLTFASARFGEFTVPAETVIEIPSGIIGFPNSTRFVMLEHKPPFSWLHSIDDPNLAFVVVDGFEFGQQFDVKPPIGDIDTDLKAEDEYAILIVVTVRPDPRLTTANLKAPVFVNMRNRKGIQTIIDDQRYSTRFPLWSDVVSEESGDADQGQVADTSGQDAVENAKR
jgi:flagellar assembly factor FliW